MSFKLANKRKYVMPKDDGNGGTRDQRRHAVSLERKAIRSGQWGDWRCTPLPNGIPGGNGWCAEIDVAYANDLYAVLVRPLETEWGTVMHCAIRTASNLEPPWRDKQRIKNELFGANSVAVEVMPRDVEVVDQADMYHMWVLPDGFYLPFTIWSEGQ